jgi:hypothetical protein
VGAEVESANVGAAKVGTANVAYHRNIIKKLDTFVGDTPEEEANVLLKLRSSLFVRIPRKNILSISS